MNYRDMIFRPSYETGIDDLIHEFYIPTLQNAKRYDRITGFFSSTSLALSAVGIAGLIQNGGTMRLITCPRLSSEDVEAMESSIYDANSILENALNRGFSVEEEFQADHVAALGWMLAKGFLSIKIALVYKDGKLLTGDEAETSSIMHQKVGLLFDSDFDGISFSGSNNESASGWLYNVEEFKVFRSWDQGQKPYYDTDYQKFERMWENRHPSVKVKTLPEAIEEKLIERGKNFDIEKIALKKYIEYVPSQKYVQLPQKEKLDLFFYQQDAVEKWENCDRKLLLEMATGCGKTRTAIGCIKKTINEIKQPILIVISCPGNTLSVQWKNDIERLDISVEHSIICDGTNPKWHINFPLEVKRLSTGYYKNLVAYTTHQTCSTDEFITTIKKLTAKVTTFFVGDEVHGMGADKSQNGLLEEYEYRLGLSATPTRWFDEAGSIVISNYFGNNSFIFAISDALKTINPLTGKPFLVNYFYHPHFIKLTDNELEEYKKLSERILRLSRSKDAEKQKIRELLLFKRADIEKAAFNKYEELERILDIIGPQIDNTIIFVSPEQIQIVLEKLAERKIVAHSFTKDEGTKPMTKYNGLSERDFIIKNFKEKKYKVLVAIKCLDEGIDIPSAKRAIVMASSTNPREYVQRIGRVIRQSQDKTNAEIYDMILQPDLGNDFNEQFREMEKRIFLKEMERVLDLSENALNNVQVLNEVYEIKRGIKV